ncbi:hypothetical protein RRG08_017103 [Elysia crispata]|uniref:Uncharacterized protein n=1 Tax=Elysia crispata TaxID=231223 RepID=A0AAE0ZPC0_9GAST|nr:hypothetical protein RRG08_017103 [Elysia crispata]
MLHAAQAAVKRCQSPCAPPPSPSSSTAPPRPWHLWQPSRCSCAESEADLRGDTKRENLAHEKSKRHKAASNVALSLTCTHHRQTQRADNPAISLSSSLGLRQHARWKLRVRKFHLVTDGGDSTCCIS